MKRLLSFLMAMLMLAGLLGCAADAPQSPTQPPVRPVDLLADIPYTGITLTYQPSFFGLTDFGAALLEAAMEEGKNTLLSPLSVMYALSMTANGAKGDTLAQMEQVLGMELEELNAALSVYMQGLSQQELRLANSIWFTDDPRFTVEQSFLQTVKNRYDAAVYRVPFDQITCRDINDWVNEKTDGMIRQILDQIPYDAVMYLVNALAFEAKWQKIYEADQVEQGVFTAADGSARPVEMMHSTESLYLDMGTAVGFLKPYEGGNYAFAALLPTEGTVEELVGALDGQTLQQLLQSPVETTVYAAIPKFESGYGVELSELLKDMGMPNAFSGELADFSGLGSSDAGNVYIGRVLHETFISVAEQGTKAGAATVVEMRDECAVMEPEEAVTVTLDRPFLYMIIDLQSGMPLFMGTLMDPAA